MAATLSADRGAWLEDARAASWRAFKETPAPAPTAETWRRLPQAAWELGRLAVSDASALGAVSPAATAAALRLGLELIDLEEAAGRYPELLSGPLGAPAAGADFRKLEAANQALWRGGAFLRIPAGVSVAEPVHIVFRYDPSREFAFPRLFIQAEEGSSATVIEEHLSAEDASGAAVKSAAFSSVRVGPGARLRLFYTQELDAQAVHFWHQRVELERDSALEHCSIMLGGFRHKSELEVALLGAGARSEIRGILLGRKKQFFDPHTQQLHQAPRTVSDLLFRTALRDEARSIYTGLIRVERSAVDCEAYQANHNLILSDGARADSTPLLEILPDAVRCKHGATAGPLNREELYYLNTRGIPEAEARRMLVLGFFEPILAQLPDEALRARLAGKVLREAL